MQNRMPCKKWVHHASQFVLTTCLYPAVRHDSRSVLMCTLTWTHPDIPCRRTQSGPPGYSPGKGGGKFDADVFNGLDTLYPGGMCCHALACASCLPLCGYDR
jgi:hypothetical protein